jgi:hypothetical protein
VFVLSRSVFGIGFPKNLGYRFRFFHGRRTYIT